MDQNITDAMNILFGIMVFIIAVSLTMYFFTTLSNTSNSIFETIGMAKYTQNVSLNADDNEDKIDDAIKRFDNRTVTKSTIIPMLHRYYKENFTVAMYINGCKSAINGIEVDYTDPNKGGWFSKLPENTKFIETVVKYQASGDVRLNTEEEYR